MYTSHRQPVIPVLLVNVLISVATCGRLLALFKLHRARREGVAPNYDGRAWCDSLEQQLITDFVTFRRPGLSRE